MSLSIRSRLESMMCVFLLICIVPPNCNGKTIKPLDSAYDPIAWRRAAPQHERFVCQVEAQFRAGDFAHQRTVRAAVTRKSGILLRTFGVRGCRDGLLDLAQRLDPVVRFTAFKRRPNRWMMKDWQNDRVHGRAICGCVGRISARRPICAGWILRWGGHCACDGKEFAYERTRRRASYRH